MTVIRDLAAGRWDRPIAKAEEATATWRRAGARFDLGNGLVWLAVVYARAGRQADSDAAMREALELFRDADSAMGIASVLQGRTYVASWQGRHSDAVRLAGAAEALREQPGGRAPVDFLAAFVGDAEASSRARLPPEVAERAFAEGRALSVDAAMALASGDP